MKTKPIASVALVVLLGLVTLPDGASALKITPANHSGLLTMRQEEELLQILLNQHPQDPGLALNVFARAIIIDPGRADKVRIIIREDEPGELPRCFGAVVIDDTIQGANLRTLDGDGSFEGPPSVFRGCGFALMLSHGTPSVHDPLKLQLNLQLADRESLTNCVDACKEALHGQLRQCDLLPTNDQAFCRQGALDAYRSCVFHCRQAAGLP